MGKKDKKKKKNKLINNNNGYYLRFRSGYNRKYVCKGGINYELYLSRHTQIQQ